MMSNYVIDVYVSSDPGTYMVRIQFTFQNRVWQLGKVYKPQGPTGAKNFEGRLRIEEVVADKEQRALLKAATKILQLSR
jgi:hypothetical protein